MALWFSITTTLIHRKEIKIGVDWDRSPKTFISTVYTMYEIFLRILFYENDIIVIN